MIRSFFPFSVKSFLEGKPWGFAQEKRSVSPLFFSVLSKTDNPSPLSKKNKDFILFSLCGKLGAPLLPGKNFEVESGGGGAVPVIRQRLSQWSSSSSSDFNFKLVLERNKGFPRLQVGLAWLCKATLKIGMILDRLFWEIETRTDLERLISRHFPTLQSLENWGAGTICIFKLERKVSKCFFLGGKHVTETSPFRFFFFFNIFVYKEAHPTGNSQASPLHHHHLRRGRHPLAFFISRAHCHFP